MDKKTQETLRKAAEYSAWEKECVWRKCRWIPLLGGVGVPLCQWLRQLELVPEGVAEGAAGLLCGAMLAGVLFTSPALGRLRRAKRRYLFHEEEDT